LVFCRVPRLALRFRLSPSKQKRESIVSSSGEPVRNSSNPDTTESDQIAWLRGHQEGKSPKKSLRLDVMGSDEDPREYDRTREVFKNGLIVTEVTGLMMCFLIIFWVFEYAGGQAWFGEKPINLHIIIMVFFTFYLHGHAALIYRMFPEQPKYAVKLAHAGLHLIVCIATGVGFMASIQHHNMHKMMHFYSFHSWLGLTAIIIYYGQFIGGFVAFLLPTTSVRIRALVLPFHRICGTAAFAFCAGSVVTGIMVKALGTIKDYADLPTAALVINFGGFFALLYSICIGSIVGDYRFRRRPRPEGELLLADATDAE